MDTTLRLALGLVVATAAVVGGAGWAASRAAGPDDNGPTTITTIGAGDGSTHLTQTDPRGSAGVGPHVPDSYLRDQAKQKEKELKDRGEGPAAH